MTTADPVLVPAKRRRSGVPTGNAGEYFVMGELLRRGYDAQLADRNTAGYDLLVGQPKDLALLKVQIKTVRNPPWYVKQSDFYGDFLLRFTIYVLLGKEDAKSQVRYFITQNSDLAQSIHRPAGWRNNGFAQFKFVAPFEDQWERLKPAI